jgi:hypothetical protein
MEAKIEKFEPKRKIGLTEREDPNRVASKMDIELAALTLPKTDTQDPARPNERRLADEPKLIKFRIDN